MTFSKLCLSHENVVFQMVTIMNCCKLFQKAILKLHYMLN